MYAADYEMDMHSTREANVNSSKNSTKEKENQAMYQNSWPKKTPPTNMKTQAKKNQQITIIAPKM